jgi:acyl-CoA synthetase (AMP-forming)/AMP-acid ligase II
MIVAPARLDHRAALDGRYDLWAGRDLPAEVPHIATLLAGMGAGRAISLTLTGETGGGARWAGDPLEPDDIAEVPGELAILTSGTVGTPRRALRSVPEALTAKRGGGPGERWLLTFSPWRWAGISVMLHCLRFDGELVVPHSTEAADLMAAAEAAGIDHLSLTPTVFRMLRLTATDAALSALLLRQITFGGEAASQAALDAALSLWPAARLTHTYASSEMGDICAVSDGIAGIPEAKFAAFQITPAGELVIGGYPTGDLWELRVGRYHFVGRVEEMINVGGAKVSPLAVEEAALAIPSVRQARARAVASPILGQLVGLEYVGEIDEDELRGSLRASLPRIAWPATVRRLATIELSDAGKMRRIP